MGRRRAARDDPRVRTPNSPGRPFASATGGSPAPGGATRDFRLRLAALADTIVVTASRTRESRAASPESMTVFTAGDIAELGSASLADVLARVSGLHVEA